MKLLFRITVLALAAVGARTLFERIRPRISGATGAGNVVGDTLTPAFRDAAANVKDAAVNVKQASASAVHEVVGATRQAAEELKDDAGNVDAGPTTGPAASAFGTS